MAKQKNSPLQAKQKGDKTDIQYNDSILKNFKIQEAEEILLGQLLTDNKIYDVLKITANDFKGKKNKMIFTAIEKCINEGHKADIKIIAMQNDNINSGYLASLTSNLVSSANWEFYQEVLLKNTYREKAHSLSLLFTDLLNQEDPEKVVKKIQSKLSELKNIKSQEKEKLTLTSLLDIEFPILDWFVERIITTGLTLLWGAAKSGKSILVLHILLALSQGGRALGTLKCKKTGVLLISLEDGLRRLQTRFKAAGAAGGDNFHIFTEWLRGQEGIYHLSQYLDENTDIRVVVIDTLFLLTQIQDGNDYSQTVIIMETLKRIADDRDIAIIVIHHSKKIGKNKPENVLETSLGSTGIVAGADHLLYLERTPSSPSDAVLHYVSKDAEPAELALHFDHTIMGWSYQGEASDIADTNERQEILDLLQKDHALRTGEIAEKLGKKTPAVSNLIKKMVGKGLVTKLSYGLYCVNKGLEPYKTTKGSECLQSSESSETSPIVGNEDSLFHDFHGGEPLKDSETQEELEIF